MKCSHILTLAAVALSAAGGQLTSAAEPRQPQIPQLKVEKYTLANGLEVILHEDHTTPVVGVNLWYKVGSKDERLGRTGFAHLFEHLMFQGSQNHDREYFAPIEKLGANINGSTNTDRTNYFETLPTNGLEVALWLEADRMGFLLPALSQAKLDNQRDVVKNERRQRVDNQPYGQASEKISAALYPPDHPYHHSVIGSMADLSAASLSDVSAFFRTYYAPNNAMLAIAGDFKTEDAKALVEKYFGTIPSGPKVPKLTPRATTLSGPKHLSMTDRVALARVELEWPTVERGHADEPALDVLASILGQLNKENRLYRPLMYDKQLAAQAGAFHRSEALAGTFAVTISARKGESLDSLVAIADAEIERLKNDGVTESEVAKVQNNRESRLITSLEGAGRTANLLNQYNFYDGDPLGFGGELKKLFAVTPQDVKRVANTYLTPNRVRMDVTPGAPTPRAPEVAVDRQGQEPVAASSPSVKDTFDRSKMPVPGPNPAFTPPPVVRRKLSNGLEVLIAERHELPVLTLNLVIQGGDVLAPQGKEGLASVTSDLLTEGTTTRGSIQLAAELTDLGATLNASGSEESCSLSMTTLSKHRDKALNLFTDVLLHPALPANELERIRTQRLNALQRRADTAAGIARTVFPRLIYSTDHPYGRVDTPTSITSLALEDVQDFYKKVFVPNNASLIVVGDTTPDAITSELESALKDWKAGEAPAAKLPDPPASKPLDMFIVDKPKAAQSEIVVGKIGVARNSADYIPLTVMNTILGGMFSSRINMNLREDKGYTYGARSSFAFRQGPGPFQAGAPVQTDKTKESLIELMKELKDITGPRPATDAELTYVKDRLVKGYPSRFETTASVAATLEELALYKLPDNYFTTYQSKIESVTNDDVTRVAKKYVSPENMVVLIVGDREVIEPRLKELPFDNGITVLDADGKPLKASSPSTESK
jgi:zinc protease